VKPVIVHSEAEAEFRAAISYYEQQRPGLGDEFQLAVQRAIEQVQQSPQALPPYGEQGVRKCLVRRFPYTVFFLELEEAIWVVAVAHQRRRPGYWSARWPE
jgi:toxin ParE1/3/4